MGEAKRRLKKRKRPSGSDSQPQESADSSAKDALTSESTLLNGQVFGGDSHEMLPRWVIMLRVACYGLLGVALAFVACFPSDSVLVERGDALWAVAILVVLATFTFATQVWHGFNRHRAGIVFDGLLFALGLWMMLGAFVCSPPCNLRMATNEAWLWLSGAALVASARRLLTSDLIRASVIAVITILAVVLSVTILYEAFISLPALRAEFLADQEAFLKRAGQDFAPNSAERMLYANRLLDGGPGGNFVLANSAAALLPWGVIVGLALLRSLFARRGDSDSANTDRAPFNGQVLLLVSVALLSGAALMATKSRSGMLSCLFGIFWLWSDRIKIAFLSRNRSMLFGGAVLVAVIGLGVLVFGDSEWIETAPSSIRFRFHYWIATLGMLTEHPWFGAGPGSFQALYPQFRLPIASESIADPHNFVFETLASGGLIAGGLLLSLCCLGYWFRRTSGDGNVVAESLDDAAPFSRLAARAVWIGSLVTLGFVGLFQLAVNNGELAVYCLIACLSLLSLFWLTLRGLTQVLDQQGQTRLMVALLKLSLLHLAFSGGWTVPGVVMPIWLLVAMLVPIRKTSEQADLSTEPSSSGNVQRRLTLVSVSSLVVGLALLLVLHSSALGPVEEAKGLLNVASADTSRGDYSSAIKFSQLASEADAWSTEPWITKAFAASSGMLSGAAKPQRKREVAQLREVWQASMQEALRRFPTDWTLFARFADQRLVVYQCFGEEADLAEAEQLLNRAVQLNPHRVALLAQLAVVAETRGDVERARDLALRAQKTSLLGGNIVRSLDRQLLLIPRKIPEFSRIGAQQAPASELLRPLLPESVEPTPAS